MELHDVVKKLVGNINPIGETQTDEIRYENLKVLCDLVNKLLADIDAVASRNGDSYEHSRKKAGEYASKFFNRLGIIE